MGNKLESWITDGISSKPTPTSTGNALAESRKKRNEAEVKGMRELANIQGQDPKKGDLIKKYKYYLDAKRRGIDVGEVDADVQEFGDMVLSYDGEIHQLKKSLGDTSFVPSPMAVESGTFNHRTKPTKPQGGTKTVQNKQIPAQGTNPQQQAPTANPVAQPKSIVSTLQEGIKTPPAVARPIDKVQEKQPLPIATPGSPAKPIVPIAKQNAMPATLKPIAEPEGRQGFIKMQSPYAPQQLKATQDVLTTNNAIGDFTEAQINTQNRVETFVKPMVKYAKKKEAELKAKSDPINILKTDSKIKEAPNEIAAFQYIVDTYGGDIGGKVYNEYMKGRTTTTSKYNSLRDDFMDTPNPLRIDTYGGGARTEPISILELTDQERSSNAFWKDFSSKVNVADLQENSKHMLPKKLDKMVSTTLTKEEKAKEGWTDTKQSFQEKIQEMNIMKDLIKVNGTKLELADIEKFNDALNSLNDEYNNKNDLFARAATEKGSVFNAMKDIGYEHYAQFFNSTFGGESGKREADDYYAKAAIQSALIELKGFKEKYGSKATLELNESNWKDTGDFASMDNLDAFGANPMTKNKGKDLNAFAWYQNIKDGIFNDRLSWQEKLSNLKNTLSSWNGIGEFAFGNATSDLKAKQLAMFILHQQGEIDMLKDPNLPNKTIGEKLDKIFKDNSRGVEVINNLTDTATMLTGFGGWAQGEALASLVGEAIPKMIKNTPNVIRKAAGWSIKHSPGIIPGVASKVGTTISAEMGIMAEKLGEKATHVIDYVTKTGVTAPLSSKIVAGFKNAENLVEKVGRSIKYEKLPNGLKITPADIVGHTTPYTVAKNDLAKRILPLIENTNEYKQRYKMFQDIYGFMPESAARATVNTFAQQFMSRDTEATHNAVETAIGMGGMDIANNVFGRLAGTFLAPLANTIKGIGANISDATAKTIANNSAHIMYQLSGIGTGIARTALNKGSVDLLDFTEEAISNMLFMHGNVKDMYTKERRSLVKDVSDIYSAYKYDKRHQGRTDQVTLGDEIISRVGKPQFTMKDVAKSMDTLENMSLSKADKEALKMAVELAGDTPAEAVSFQNSEKIPDHMRNETCIVSDGTVYYNTDKQKDVDESFNNSTAIFSSITHELNHNVVDNALDKDTSLELDFALTTAPLMTHMANEGFQQLQDNPELMVMWDHMFNESNGQLDMSEFYAQYMQTDSALRRQIDALPDKNLRDSIRNLYKDRVLVHVEGDKKEAAMKSIERVHAMAIRSIVGPNQISMFDEESDDNNIGTGVSVGGFESSNSLSDNTSFMPKKTGFTNSFDMKEYYLGKPREEVYTEVKDKLLRSGMSEETANKEALSFSYKMSQAEKVPICKLVTMDGEIASMNLNVTGRNSGTKLMDNIFYKDTYNKKAIQGLRDDIEKAGYYSTDPNRLRLPSQKMINEIADNMSNVHVINHQHNVKGRVIKDDLSVDDKVLNGDNRNRGLYEGWFFTPGKGTKAIPMPEIGKALKAMDMEQDSKTREAIYKQMQLAASGIAKHSFFKMVDQKTTGLMDYEKAIDFTRLVKSISSKDEISFVKPSAIADGFKPEPELINKLKSFATDYFKGVEEQFYTRDYSNAKDDIKTGKNADLEAAMNGMNLALNDYYAWTYDPTGANRFDGTTKHQVKYAPVINTREEHITSKQHFEDIMGLSGKDNTEFYKERGWEVSGDHLTSNNFIPPPEVVALLDDDMGQFFRDNTADGGVYITDNAFDSLCDFRGVKPEETHFLKLKAADSDFINKAGWHRNRTNYVPTVTESGVNISMTASPSAYKAKYSRRKNLRRHTDGNNWIDFSPENRIMDASSPEYKQKWIEETAQKMNNQIFPDELIIKQAITGDNGYSFVQEGHSPKASKGFAFGTAGSVQLAYGQSPAMKDLRKTHREVYDRLLDYHTADIEGIDILDSVAHTFMSNGDYRNELTSNELYKAGRVMSKLADKLMRKFGDNDIPNSLKAIINPQEMQVLLSKCVNGDGTLNTSAFAELAIYYPDIAAREKSDTQYMRKDTLKALSKMTTEGFMVTMAMPQDVRQHVEDGLKKIYDKESFVQRQEGKRLKELYDAFNNDSEFNDWLMQKENLDARKADLDKEGTNATDQYTKSIYESRLAEFNNTYNQFVNDPEYQSKMDWFAEKQKTFAELEEARKKYRAGKEQWEVQNKAQADAIRACINPKTGAILPGARLPDGSIPLIIGKNEIRLLNKHKSEKETPILPSVATTDLHKSINSKMPFIGEMPVEMTQGKASNNDSKQSEYIDYNDIKNLTNYRGINLEIVKDIPTTKDKPVVARVSKDRTRMQIDPDAVAKAFDNKEWRQDSIQSDGSQATPLDDSHFQTKEDYLNFCLLHEATHKDIIKSPDETIGQYEDRVNQQALIDLAKQKPTIQETKVLPHKPFNRKANQEVLVNVNSIEGSLPDIMAQIDKAAGYNNTMVIPNHKRNLPLINYCRENGYKVKVLMYDKFSGEDAYIPPTTSGRDWFNKNAEEMGEIGVGSRVFGVLTASAGVESMVPMTIIGIGDNGLMHTDNDYMTKYLGRDFDADKMGIMGYSPFFPEEHFNRYYDQLLNLFDGKGSKTKKGIEENPLAVIDAINSRPKNDPLINFDHVGAASSLKPGNWTSRPQDPKFIQGLGEIGNNISKTIGTRNTLSDNAMLPDSQTGLYNELSKNFEDFSADGMSGISATINTQVQKAVDSYDYRKYAPDDLLKAVAERVGAPGIGKSMTKEGVIIPGKYTINQYEPHGIGPSSQIPFIGDGRKDMDVNAGQDGVIKSMNQALHQRISSRMSEYLGKQMKESNAGLYNMLSNQKLSDYNKNQFINTENKVRTGLNFTINAINKGFLNNAHLANAELRNNGVAKGGANIKFIDSDMASATFGPQDAAMKARTNQYIMVDSQGHTYQTIATGTVFNIMSEAFRKREPGKSEGRAVSSDGNPNARQVLQYHDKVELVKNGEVLETIPYKEFFHEDGRPNKIPPELQNTRLWEVIQSDKTPKHLITEVMAGLGSNMAKWYSSYAKEQYGADVSPDVIAPRLIYGEWFDSKNPSKAKYNTFNDTSWMFEKTEPTKGDLNNQFHMSSMGMPEKFNKYGITPKFLKGNGQQDLMVDMIKNSVARTTSKYFNNEATISALRQEMATGGQRSHAMSMSSISGIRREGGVSRFETVKEFSKYLSRTNDYMVDGRKATLYDVVQNPDLYEKFHQEVLSPMVYKLLGKDVGNRDELASAIVDLYSPINMQAIGQQYKNESNRQALRGLALAELGDHITKINQSERFAKAGKLNDFSLLRSTVPSEIIDRTASVRKGYTADQIVTPNFIMKDGHMVEVAPTVIGDLTDRGTHVASPLIMKSPLEIECIRPLESMRRAMDNASEILGKLEIGDINVDKFVDSSLKIHVNVDQDGVMGQTRYVDKFGNLEVFDHNVALQYDKETNRAITAMQSIKAAGGALKIASAKLSILMENAPPETIATIKEQMRKIDIMADKMIEGDADYLKNRSLSSDMTNSDVAQKLSDMIFSVQKAEAQNLHNKMRLKNSVHEQLGTRMPMNMMFDDNYSNALDEVSKIAEHMSKSDKVHENDATDYSDYLVKNLDPNLTPEQSAKNYYESKAKSILSTAANDLRNRYKDFDRALPEDLDSFYSLTSQEMRANSTHADDYINIDKSTGRNLAHEAKQEVAALNDVIAKQTEQLKTLQKGTPEWRKLSREVGLNKKQLKGLQSSVNNKFKRTFKEIPEAGVFDSEKWAMDLTPPSEEHRNRIIEDIIAGTKLLPQQQTDPNGNKIRLSALSSMFDNLQTKIDFTQVAERRKSMEADIKRKRNVLSDLGVDVKAFDKILQDRTHNLEDVINQMIPEGVDNYTKAVKYAYQYANAYKSGVAEHVRNGWRYARNAAEKGNIKAAYAEYKKWYDYVAKETSGVRNLGDLGNGTNTIEDFAKKGWDTAKQIHEDIRNNNGVAYEMMRELNVPGFHKQAHEFANPAEYTKLSTMAQSWFYKSQERFIKECTNALKTHDWYGNAKRDEFVYTDTQGSTQSMPMELVMEGITPAMLCQTYDKIMGNTDVQYTNDSSGIVKHVTTAMNRIMHIVDAEMIKKVHSYGETKQHTLDVASRAVGRGYKNNLIFNRSNEQFVNIADVKAELATKPYYQHCEAGTPVLVQVRQYNEDSEPNGSYTDVIGDIVGYYSRSIESDGGATSALTAPTMVIYDPQTHQLHNIDMNQVDKVIQGDYNGTFPTKRFEQAKEAYQKHSEELLKALSDNKLMPTTVYRSEQAAGPVRPNEFRSEAYVPIGSEFRAKDSDGTVAAEAISALRTDLDAITKSKTEKLLDAAYLAKIATTYGLAGPAIKIAAAVPLAFISPAFAGGLALKGFVDLGKKGLVKQIIGNAFGVSGGTYQRGLGNKGMGLLKGAFTPFINAFQSYGSTLDSRKHSATSDVMPTQGADLVKNRLQTITAEEIAYSTFSKDFRKQIAKVQDAQDKLKILTDAYETKMKYHSFDEVRTVCDELMKQHKMDYDGISITKLGKNDFDLQVHGYNYADIKNFKASLGDQLLHYATAGGLFQRFEQISTRNSRSVAENYVRDMAKRVARLEQVAGDYDISAADVHYGHTARTFMEIATGNYERTPAQETILGKHLSLFRNFNQERALDGQAYYMRRCDLYKAMSEFMSADPKFYDMCVKEGLQGIVAGEHLLYRPRTEAINRLPMTLLGATTNGFPKAFMGYGLIEAWNKFVFMDNKYLSGVWGEAFAPLTTIGDMIGIMLKDIANFVMFDDPRDKKNDGTKLGLDEYGKIQERAFGLPSQISKKAFGLGVGQSDIVDLLSTSAMAMYLTYKDASFDVGKSNNTKNDVDNNTFFSKFATTSANVSSGIIPFMNVFGDITVQEYKELTKKDKKKSRGSGRSYTR